MRTHSWGGVLAGCALTATAAFGQGKPATVPASASATPEGKVEVTAAVPRKRVPFLGVVTSPVDPSLRRSLDLPDGIGLVVSHTEAGSPAAAAGIRAGDV